MTCLYEKVDAEYMPGAFKQGLFFSSAQLKAFDQKKKIIFKIK